jgi:hypothetical protein
MHPRREVIQQQGIFWRHSDHQPFFGIKAGGKVTRTR